jgi:lactoylglutathione lyase
MKLSDLVIIIENLRGSYKKFADSLDEYSILGVTFPTHYGYIKGYISEDNHDLDVFVGNGSLFGFIKIKRDDVPGGIETKVFLHISKDEYTEIENAYMPVIETITLLPDENTFLSFLQKFKDMRPNLGTVLIGVQNLEKSKMFYENAFGMIIDEFRPPFMEGHLGDNLVFNIEENDDIRDVGWKERNIGTYKNSILSVPDMKLFIQKVRAHGGSLIQEPKKMPWGYTEAHIIDPDGNIFVIESKI